MRYDAAHKEKTRTRVLKVAAKAIRTQGPHRIAVAGVMAKAGMTHGGFYVHFASKDAFLAAAVDHMFTDSFGQVLPNMEARSPAEALTAYVDWYLSAAHRDNRNQGCPLPYLVADAPRLPRAARLRIAQGMEQLRRAIARKITELGLADADDEAQSVISALVGAIALARAEPDHERSDAILASTRAGLMRRLKLATTH
ncbi:MAG: TetR/AcrR family transcriptional regulator [Phenylobacterium sp.]|uniref:TetR/AcrR family transcriptional regulator n=1 Tax=Phenylobacterium sp. TaxID=1871053 RepID=UPI0027344850|nr:TetR/AcrR family transcriptional regulator [Phenylobacterium sp.]MDP3749598.1 TetR/AcrR family transcriptional regulator [Phenylobacterium sp.]